jgi:hypothetical protein
MLAPKLMLTRAGYGMASGCLLAKTDEDTGMNTVDCEGAKTVNPCDDYKKNGAPRSHHHCPRRIGNL